MRARPFSPAFIALVFSLVVATGRALARAEDNAAGDAEAARIQQQLDRPLPQINFDKVGLADAVDFLRDVTGLNIWVDWHALAGVNVAKDTHITMRVRNTLGKALDHLLANLGPEEGKLGYTVVGRVMVISTADGMKAAADAVRAVEAKAHPGEAKQLLEQRVLPEVNFDATPLTDAIDFLRDVSGAEILVDWTRLEAAGAKRDTPVSIRLVKIPIGQALALILREASGKGKPLDFAAKGKVITISTAAALKGKGETAPAPERAAEKKS
jgi:hypothetical protein